jgi:hypothetical protein
MTDKFLKNRTKYVAKLTSRVKVSARKAVTSSSSDEFSFGKVLEQAK